MSVRRKCVNQRIEELEIAADVEGRAGDEVLVRAVGDSSPSVRTAAINLLAWRPGAAGVEAVLRAVSDRHALVRIAAVEAMGIRRLKESRPLLVDSMLNDSDSVVRAFAADSLGLIGGARRALLTALESERSDQARLSILCALGRNGGSEYVFRAMGFLWASDYRVRCAAANIMVEFVSGRERELFVLILERLSVLDESLAVRDTAQGALKNLMSSM